MLKEIKIDNLKLALDNPRLTDSQNEYEEIQKMVEDQRKKLLNLADDIIKYGLNPLDTIAVYPSVEKDKFIVAEGNRRIVTIKILNNPELIKDIDSAIYKGFKKLQTIYKPILSISCFVFKSDLDPNLIHWIEIKHLGENKGKGTANWSSMQKARFDKKYLGESKLLDFWEELTNLNILTSEEIFEITKTNWERILRDYGLKFLKIINTSTEYIIPKDDILEFTKKIKEIHRLLANQSVGLVYDQEKIEDFYNTVSINLYNKEYHMDEQLSLQFMETEKESNQENSIIPNELKANMKVANESSSDSKIHSFDDKKIDNATTGKRDEKDMEGSCQITEEKNKDDNIEIFDNPKKSKFLNNINFSNIDTASKRYVGLIDICNEIISINYTRFPIAAAILSRTLLDQSLRYFAEKHSLPNKTIYIVEGKGADEKIKSELGLEKVLKEYLNAFNNPSCMSAFSPEFKTNFNSLFVVDGGVDVKESRIKIIFDYSVHHPHIMHANPQELENFSNNGFLYLINYLLNE